MYYVRIIKMKQKFKNDKIIYSKTQLHGVIIKSIKKIVQRSYNWKKNLELIYNHDHM